MSERSVMSVSRWWQVVVGSTFGAVAALAHPVAAVVLAVVVGLALAWASLTRDGDDALTAVSAGYLTGVLGWGLISLMIELTWSPAFGAG